MATTKKSTGKSTATKSSTTAKKRPVRPKASSRATSTKRSASTSKSRKPSARSTKTKSSTQQSFHVSKPAEPFMSLKVTVQTLYWLILSGAVLMLGLWVLDIHNKVQDIYDDIEESNIIQQELDQKELEMLRQKASEDKKA